MRVDFEEHLSTLSETRIRGGKSGPQVLVRDCPLCGDDGWHLYVNARTGYWKCFKCSQSGSYLRLGAAFSGIPVHEAARSLRGLPRRRAPGYSSLEKIKERLDALTWDHLLPPPEIDVPLPAEFLGCRVEGGWRVPRPVKKRGFRRSTLAEFGLGFCLLGKYRNRIVVPIVTGTSHAFQSRAFTKGQDPKYLSPSVDMSRLLFGEPWLGPRERFVVVVEGVFDALRLWEYGLPAVSTLGKTVSERQAVLIGERTEKVILFYDSDDDGIFGPVSEATRILSSVVREVKVAWPPEGKDPDECTRDEVVQSIKDSRNGADVSSVLGRRVGRL